MTVRGPTGASTFLPSTLMRIVTRKSATADNREPALTSSDSENEFCEINFGKNKLRDRAIQSMCPPVRTARFSMR
jgi:hypothetical protein